MGVKVVILGLDPYPQETNGIPNGCGLAFSYRRDFPVPSNSSLHNIFKELAKEYPGYVKPNHGDLSSWCKQGVLLLNTALTVLPMMPKSHLNIWEPFISNILNIIVQVNPNVVFLLWGGDAKKMVTKIGKAKYFETSHPSGQSAYRGFIGCNHFTLANQYLVEKGLTPIDWNVY